MSRCLKWCLFVLNGLLVPEVFTDLGNQAVISRSGVNRLIQISVSPTITQSKFYYTDSAQVNCIAKVLPRQTPFLCLPYTLAALTHLNRASNIWDAV